MFRSPKALKHARGQDCTLRLPGCQNNTETTVACHVGRRGGRGIKCGDNMIVFGCYDCHSFIDGGYVQHGWTREQVDAEKFRALEETQEILFHDGVWHG